MSEPRRSSRANKGQHSRDALELYYEVEEDVKRRKIEADLPFEPSANYTGVDAISSAHMPTISGPATSKLSGVVGLSKTTSYPSTFNPATTLSTSTLSTSTLSTSDPSISDPSTSDPSPSNSNPSPSNTSTSNPSASSATNQDAPETEEVRCDPCGTTSANYDEATDSGGVMIECEQCQTWQHAKCMGYRHRKAIPQAYTCRRCAPPKDKTRASVCKALLNVVLKVEPAPVDGRRLADRIEEAIYEWSGTADKKYIDKSRSVMALVRKPAVLAKVALGALAMSSLVLLPPAEIDAELKHYAEKVRQELIRRSVLTVEDDASHRIRRTHKGEEVVETPGDADDYHVSVVGRTVDHRVFDKDPLPSVIVAGTQGPNLYLLGEDNGDTGLDNVKPEENADRSEDENAAGHNHSDSDDELDFILNRNKPESTAPVPAPVPAPAPVSLPPLMPARFWSGEVTFPDFATFDAAAHFVGCTNYRTPNDVTSASFHNRALRVCKELFEKPRYLIEGRLDRTRADPYLSQVLSSRDLYLMRLADNSASEHVEWGAGYEKVFHYLLAKRKVGVLSNRASFVKDAYLFAVDGDAPTYMPLTSLPRGLYALFVVKKDYMPVGKSILKKSLPPQQAAAVASLDSILSKLESGSFHGAPQHYANMDLNAGQTQHLTELINQNPHAQNNPQALLNLLQNQLARFQ